MALVLKDRVRETTTTTGTGTLTLAGAVTGFQTFSTAIGNGNTTYYTIAGQGTSEWEVGLGTIAAGTLARTTVLASSNAGALVTFSAGTKDVFCDYPASAAVYNDTTDNNVYEQAFAVTNGIVFNANTIATSVTFPTNYNGVSAGPITINTGITVTVPTGATWVVV